MFRYFFLFNVHISHLFWFCRNLYSFVYVCKHSYWLLLFDWRATYQNGSSSGDIVWLTTFTQLLHYCKLSMEYITIAEKLKINFIHGELRWSFGEAVNLYVLQYSERCSSCRSVYSTQTKREGEFQVTVTILISINKYNSSNDSKEDSSENLNEYLSEYSNKNDSKSCT